jgi:hypothetical protein
MKRRSVLLEMSGLRGPSKDSRNTWLGVGKLQKQGRECAVCPPGKLVEEMLLRKASPAKTKQIARKENTVGHDSFFILGKRREDLRWK